MRLETLEEFIVFAKHLNFSGAARELYISQPSLSTHMRNLEKELGFDLVSRKEPLALTPAGMAFLECAQDTLEAYRSGYGKCLATLSSPPARVLAFPRHPLVKDALRRAEGIPFALRSDYRGVDILGSLRDGEVDIVVCFDVRGTAAGRMAEAGVEAFSFGSGQLAMAVSRSHPLSDLPSISKSDLAGVSICVTDSAYFDYWCDVLREQLGSSGDLSFRYRPVESWSSVAFGDLGNSVYVCGSEVIEENLGQRDDVRIVKEFDGEALSIRYAVYYRKGCEDKNVRALLDVLRQASGEE